MKESGLKTVYLKTKSLQIQQSCMVLTNQVPTLLAKLAAEVDFPSPDGQFQSIFFHELNCSFEMSYIVSLLVYRYNPKSQVQFQD